MITYNDEKYRVIVGIVGDENTISILDNNSSYKIMYVGQDTIDQFFVRYKLNKVKAVDWLIENTFGKIGVSSCRWK